MINVVSTAVIYGIDTHLVSVEAHMSVGIPQISIIGLADQTIREAKERLVVALMEQGIKLGNRKYIVSLNPTDIKKQGGHLDLPMAIALLKASNLLPQSKLRIGALGGINLSGELTASNELFSLVGALAEADCDYILMPKSGLSMLKFFKKAPLIGMNHLSEVIDILSLKDHEIEKVYLEGLETLKETSQRQEAIDKNSCNENHPIGMEIELQRPEGMNFKYVIGQEVAKRAILIALAGHHHLLMYGPPGTGKSMLASCIPTVQPLLREQGLYEHFMIRSRGGYAIDYELKVREPFRMPHTGISASAMLGGMRANMLGEASLAHRGVLFLDEMPEYKRDVVEGLRGPLEDGRIHLSKTQYKGVVPADFTLVATANPCPCGYHGFSDRCNCNEREINRYFSKLSGPILDRFDLKVEVAFREGGEEQEGCLDETEGGFLNQEAALSSEQMAEAIFKVREIQKCRYGDENLYNGTLDSHGISKWCKLEEKAQNWMKANIKTKSGEDSMRCYNKILKVGRTIADLEGSEVIERKHLIEAFYYNRRKLI